MSKGNILVVEDDLNLSFLLMELLQNEGFRVRVARDGIAGLDLLSKENFDMCLLDVTMPKLNGYNLAKHIIKDFAHTPFIFLTARILKEDRLKGYELGAEDYIIKPFDDEELLCKINVVLRRKQEKHITTHNGIYQIGQFTFDKNRMELRIVDNVRRLTEIESKVLEQLCLHKNRILRRDEAVQTIYGKKDYFLGRSFDVFISKIRKKLSVDPSIEIENVYKVGFILNIQGQNPSSQA